MEAETGKRGARGAVQQKYAPARGRDERKKRKGTVRTVLCLLGSCLRSAGRWCPSAFGLNGTWLIILGRPQSTFLALLPMVHSEDVGLTPRKRGIRPSASAV